MVDDGAVEREIEAVQRRLELRAVARLGRATSDRVALDARHAMNRARRAIARARWAQAAAAVLVDDAKIEQFEEPLRLTA